VLRLRAEAFYLVPGTQRCTVTTAYSVTKRRRDNYELESALVVGGHHTPSRPDLGAAARARDATYAPSRARRLAKGAPRR
jgi:hypothetical protein